MRTTGREARLADFADRLRGQRVAIVYSHRFGIPLDDNWYHRWQTNVIALFSQAVEHCGAIPVFFDIDQWLNYCASGAGEVQFMVNLNAGNRSLDQWSIAPALGGWRSIPTFPCSAFTVMLGEAKDVAKRLALGCGWIIPRNFDESLDEDSEVIRKPRTYGSSVGLERLRLRDVEDAANPEFIVEEFIRGYDATVVTFFSAVTGRLECQGAQAMLPATSDPADWVYDSFEKRNPGVRTQVAFPFCPVDAELAKRAVDMTRVFGGEFVSRIDVRVTTAPSSSAPIKFEDCVFLEINPMPTIGPTNSVTELAARYVERHADDAQISWIADRSTNRIERAAIYLLSCGLMVVSSR
jgi:hypothetical protein